MKKILLFVPYDRGTIAIVSNNLFNALKSRSDVEIKVIVLLHHAESVFSFESAEYLELVGQKYLKPFQFFKRLWWLKKIKKKFKPDITINTLFICSILSVLTGGTDKKIGIFHSPHSQSKVNGWHTLLISYLSYKFIYNKLEKLYCVSSEVYESIVDRFKNISSKKVEIVYNIHNIDFIRKQAEKEMDSKHQMLFKNNYIVLYCGRLDKNKAPNRTVDAFILAMQQLPTNTKLVFIGKDYENLWPELNKMADKAKLNEKVVYLNLQQNPYPYILNADMIISSSYSEGLPGILIESLLLRTPIVTTNSSKGIWEIVSSELDYNAKLDRNFRTNYGIITPNLSLFNHEAYISDCRYLSAAMIEVMNEKKQIDFFEFESQISSDKIVEKFLI